MVCLDRLRRTFVQIGIAEVGPDSKVGVFWREELDLDIQDTSDLKACFSAALTAPIEPVYSCIIHT